MNNRTHYKKLIKNLFEQVLNECIYKQELDFKYYIDKNFYIYFNDLFFKPLEFLRFKPKGCLLGGTGDSFHEDYFKNLQPFKDILDFLKEKTSISENKITETLINFVKFTAYYPANMLNQFQAWDKEDKTILDNILRDFLKNPDDINNPEKREGAKKYYIRLLCITIAQRFDEILYGNIFTNKVISKLKYTVSNIITQDDIDIPGKYIIRAINPVDTEQNAIDFNKTPKRLLPTTPNKEITIIEIPLELKWNYSKDTSKDNEFKETINQAVFTKLLYSFKHRELILNSINLLNAGKLKIISDTYYILSFRTLFLTEQTFQEDFTLTRNIGLSFNKKIMLSKKDKNKLIDLYKMLEPISEFNVKNKKLQFLVIAIDFYKDALRKENPNQQIAYSIQALEALYNTSKEQITRTIRQRTSLMMGILKEIKPVKYKDKNLNPSLVDKTIRDAYNIRSKYVHGQNTKQEISTDLICSLFEYTRLSILLFLYLLSSKKERLDKDKINTLLDDCLLNKQEHSKLVKRLKLLKLSI